MADNHIHSVSNKSAAFSGNPLFLNLNPTNREFLNSVVSQYQLTQQDVFNVVEIATDFEMWGVGLLPDVWDDSDTDHLQGKRRKQEILGRLIRQREQFRMELPDYTQTPRPLEEKGAIKFTIKNNNDPVLGLCPVFSDKTRCCNLQTLDAVMNCGYECSYCSIQSFYHGEEIIFQGNLKEKLDKIEIDPDKIYHIGTGQSSDSLLWGNKQNVLEDLLKWAAQYPNVILELKTKSANIHYLLNNPVPPNVIVTWSLNAETIVQNEEHRTAALSARLSAARKVADKGILVGFHLHPIVAFQGWRTEYPELVSHLTKQFIPEEVALVSLGTLTFIKPVVKQLRQRKIGSKILQMPFEDAAGKTSYPLDLKKEFFKTVYDSFAPWHEKVFFYLCMEDSSLWPHVFGFDYATNAEFENAMKAAYMMKVTRLRTSASSQ
jgi:spore photoproduct lyase